MENNENSEKKIILVTGGAGFLGSFLCEELVKTAKVICMDNFVSSSVHNIEHLLQYPDFKFIKYDCSDPFDLETFPELEDFDIKYKGISEVYHLACPTSAKNFDHLRIDTAKANSFAVKYALDVAVKYKAKFLFTSSAVVYGSRETEDPYFSESHMGIVDFLSPRACYDEGKQFAESMVRTYRDVHKLNTKIVRVFRTYGPRMMINDGHMIPDFIVNALEGKDLVIYGDETFETALCYYSDVIEGMIKVMHASKDVSPINLGSDIAVNLYEFAQKVVEMTGSSSKIVFEKPLEFMTPLGLPDLTKAKEMLAWLPVVSLDAGLKKTIEYMRVQKGLVGVTGRK